MNILVIPSWYPPAGGNFFREHCEGLHREGARVYVFACELKSLKQFTLKEFIKGIKIRQYNENGLSVFRLTCWKIPKSEYLNIKWWSWHIQKMAFYFFKKFERPDIIHVHCAFYAGWPASKISAKYNIPYVITENRSRFVNDNPYAKNLIRNMHIPFFKKAFGGASKIITVCSRLQPTIEQISNVEPERFITVPNPVDVHFFQPDLKRPTGKPFIFFSLGLLEFVKGMDILLKAFSKFLLTKNIDAELWIGGTGSLKNELINLSKELKVENRVKFLGQLSRQRVRDYMNKADAFALATRFEAFGVVFIEALASGIPVIGTRSGGPDEIIIPEAGILIDIDDADQLCEAMISVYDNYNKYNRQFIRDYAVANFSRQIIASRTLKIMNDVLGNNH